MNKFFYLAIASVFIVSCSSSSNIGTDVKAVESNSFSNKSIVSTVNQPDTNAEISVNKNEPALQDATVSKKNAKSWEGRKSGNDESKPIAANIAKVVTAAPDNSEVSSDMNLKGQPVEIRSFKNHPLLIKVERVDLDNSNVKVYLKNGKVLTIPEDKASGFLTASASEILEAVGVKSQE